MGAGFYSEDRRGNSERAGGAFLGPLCTVAGGEMLAVALTLEQHDEEMLFILSDSRTATSTTREKRATRVQENPTSTPE